MVLGLHVVPLVLFVAASAALAGLLLAVDFQHRVNRAFALFLALRAAGSVPVLLIATGDPAWASYGGRLVPYFFLPLAPAALYFAAVYPRPRAWLRRVRPPWLPFVAAMVVLDVLYVVQRPLFQGGPLVPLVSAYSTVYGLVALLFLRDAARPLPASARRSAFLVGLGFALVPLWDGLSALVGPPPIRELAPVEALRWVAFMEVAVGAAFAAAVAWQAARAPEAAARSQARRALGLLAVLLLSAALLWAFPSSALNAALAGAWRLAMPLLVTYAILRHQLFGIDVKVKWTIRQSTVAAAFIGVFFVVSESASQFFADADGGLGLGTYAGIAAAGLLVFAMAPLQRAAERVASAAMPGARAPGELSAAERLDVYREQVRAAWADGAISGDERRLLEAARARLGIGAEEALRLEREAAP